MKLEQLLTELKKRMPSALSDEDWILFINSAIRRYGRYLGKSNLYKFRTSGLKCYPLPPSVSGECIKTVTVGGCELEPVMYSENMPCDSFSLDPSGFILFGSSYEPGVEISILYNGTSQFDTIGELAARGVENFEEVYLNQDCGCDDEYIDAIIYYAMSSAAEVSEDIFASDNYKRHAEEIVRGAMQSRYSKRGKYPTIRPKRGQRLWKHYMQRH